MASAEIEPAGAQKIRRNLVGALVSAFLEWFLIIFLFVDAGISFVITKFARGCKLQTPCLLCSRLDHVLGKEKMGYHWDLMCKHHKSEISSLVHCRAHNKLVDVHKMCENCLFSFATINKSNAETYRLLVGKLGEEFNSDLDCDDSLVEDENFGFLSGRNCACCNQPWAPRGRARAKELIQTRFGELERVFSGSVDHDHEVTRTVRDRSASLTVSYSRQGERDHLPHIGYTELKINSDTESEALHSDDDDIHGASVSANVDIHERDNCKEEFSAKSTEPQIVIVNEKDLASDKLLDPETEPRPSLFESRVKDDEETIELVDCNAREEESQVKDDEETIELVDCNAREEESQVKDDEETIELVDCKTRVEESQVKDDKETIELVDRNAQEQESQAKEDDETIELVDCKAQKTVAIVHGLVEPYKQEVGNEADRITETTIHTSLPSHETETIVQVSQSSYVETTIEVGETSVAKFNEVLEREALPNSTAETSSETNAVTSDSGRQVTSSLDLGDAYKLAVDTRGKQISVVLADQWLGKDSSRITEDLKILLSQLSANRGLDPQISDISPKLSVNSDDAKSLDHYNSFGMQRLQKRISLERNESGLSLDGSIVSEIEGESAVDRLKRQAEHDKKLMAALYKELEEERNASAVATNQAMAMITRLQEEKAALHMEALQYLRMMEEQAEYDDDELQKSNDLLAEKEKEVQDLEAELEFYKKKFPNERYLENVSETSGDMRITDIGMDDSEQYSCVRDKTSVSVHPIPGKTYIDDKNVDTGDADSSIPEFEDKKTYILQALERLEKTLHLLNNGEYDCFEEHDASVSGQGLHGKGNTTLSLDDPEINDESHLMKQNSTESSQVTVLASLGVMISGLNKRLGALEADRRFLEHTISSLRNGEEGVQFVQEIASHLRELRRIAMRKDQLVD